MSVQSRKSASRKEIKSPITDEVFVIRKLSAYEISTSQLNTILGGIDELKEKEQPGGFKADIILQKMGFESERRVLEFGTVDPPIFFGDEDKTPDGSMHVRWLAEDRLWLAAEIMNLSGLNAETRDKVEAVLKNANSAASSTPLVADTGDVRVNS